MGIEYSIATREFPAWMQYRQDLELKVGDEITWEILSWKVNNQSKVFDLNSNYTFEDFYLSLKVLKLPNGEVISYLTPFDIQEYLQLSYINRKNSSNNYDQSGSDIYTQYLIPTILDINNKTENIFEYWINHIYQTTSEFYNENVVKTFTQYTTAKIKDSVFYEDKRRISDDSDVLVQSLRYHTQTGILLYYSSNSTSPVFDGNGQPFNSTTETIIRINDSPLELPTNFYYLEEESLNIPNLIFVPIVILAVIVLIYKMSSRRSKVNKNN